MARVFLSLLAGGLVQATVILERGPFYHRESLFQEVRARRGLEGGKTQTQRWTGAQSSNFTEHLQHVTCSFAVPDKILNLSGQAHYIYCDLHYNDWPDHSFGQFVPQLMRGDVVAANDVNYTPINYELQDWHIQAQYIWSAARGPVKAYVGKLIKVNVGDILVTSMYTSPDGAWQLRIAVDGGEDSTISIEIPFMGTDSAYQLPYGSRNAPVEYRRWVLGDLHEAWAMDSAKYYPPRMDWAVMYRENRSASESDVNQVVMSHCVDHVSQTQCPNDVMTALLEEQVAGICNFHVDRAAGAIFV